jgi:hypothetical protein
LKLLLTPQEFRALLDPKLQSLFDDLVKNMGDYGIDEKQAERYVAQMLFQSVTNPKKRADEATPAS